MKELFEYILIALACPLVLPLVESQESEGILEEINEKQIKKLDKKEKPRMAESENKE